MLKTDPRAIVIPYTREGDKVILAEKDFIRLLSHVSERHVEFLSQLALKPKAKTKKAKANGKQ